MGDEKLFTALARAAELRVSDFKLQGLANTAWAFVSVNRPDEKLFTALARVAEQRGIEFNAQELANTAWAFATVTWPDEKLFTALARAAERQIHLCFKTSTGSVIDVIGIVWALNSSEMFSLGFYRAVRK